MHQLLKCWPLVAKYGLSLIDNLRQYRFTNFDEPITKGFPSPWKTSHLSALIELQTALTYLVLILLTCSRA